MGNNLAKFRNVLAEQGIEMTMEQAAETHRLAKDLLEMSNQMSMEDIWALQDVEGMPQEEKDQIIKLYQQVKEL